MLNKKLRVILRAILYLIIISFFSASAIDKESVGFENKKIDDSIKNAIFQTLKKDRAYSSIFKDSLCQIDTIFLINKKTEFQRIIIAGVFQQVNKVLIFDIKDSKFSLLKTVESPESNKQQVYLFYNNNLPYLINHLFYTGGTIGNTPQNIIVYALNQIGAASEIGSFEFEFGEMQRINNQFLIKSEKGIRRINIKDKKAEFDKLDYFKSINDLPENHNIIFFSEKNDNLFAGLIGQKQNVALLNYDYPATISLDSIVMRRSFLELDINTTLLIDAEIPGSLALFDPDSICKDNFDAQKTFDLPINMYDKITGIREGTCALIIAKFYLLPIKFKKNK